MESFFASLKKEHVHQTRFRTCEEARAAVLDYLELPHGPSANSPQGSASDLGIHRRVDRA
jgi:Integrase core domain